MARVHTSIESPDGRKSFLRSRTMVWLVSLLVVLGVAGAVVRATIFGGQADPMAGIPLYTVTQGPLLISVSESGTIKSRQQETIKCEVEGGSTILYLIPEGTHVKKGDLLVELDASKLEDQRVAQEITVKNAEAASIGANEAYEVAKSQAQSDIAKAELDARFAKEDLTKYKEGDYLTQHADSESAVKLAQEKLEQAKNKRDWSQKLYEAKYISESEYELDVLAYKSANLDVERAKNALALLENFTYKRQIDELSSNIDQTAMALDRVKRKAKADVIQAEAARDAKKSEFDRQTSSLAKVKRMIDATKIYAPVDGLVVYASSSDGGWRFNREPLIEGSIVRERQDLINLPTTSSVMAEVKVHESSLEKLSVGLPVRVTVDALPGKVFTGKVASIAPLPDAGSMWLNPDMKVYNTQIYLDQGDDNLRTGMSCRAEIMVANYSDAVYVPVQSVIRVGNHPTVFLAGPKGPEPHEVKLGLDNNRMVRVVSGLNPGQQVLLNPPLAAASTSDTDTGMPPANGMFAPGAIPSGSTTRPARAGPDARDRNGPAGNLTPEQRAEMRKRLENMTPEQREQMRQRRPDGQGGQRGPGARGNGGGRDSNGAGRSRGGGGQ